ncbi:PAS domain-containing protein [Roseococcus sp.]|uniref:PAS domain-containing protein n=1 Tax=Roseococcus sp. TaxID=2109646 RepID=UPI003BAD1359
MGLLSQRRKLARGVSLQASLLGLLLLVFIPTLGVLGISLYGVDQSYRDASNKHLLETAHVVAQSVSSELMTAARLLADHDGGSEINKGDPPDTEPRRNGQPSRVISVLPALTAHSVSPVERLAATAAATGRYAVSNIFAADDGTPSLAIAAPAPRDSAASRVAVMVGQPGALIRTLQRERGFDTSLVLAVADGAGHVIARSRDAEAFIGRPVPDWGRLMALGTASGLFEARALEGPSVVFAFQAISGTPGWVSVVGEPLSAFQARWQQPLRTMLIASGLTIATALLLGLLLARRVLRPIHQLAAHARSVAEGGGPGLGISKEVPGAFVAEFETLRQTLASAEAAMRRSALAERSMVEALTVSELRYRTIAGIGALAFWRRARSGPVTEISGLQGVTGIPDEQARGDGWLAMTHPDDLPRVDQAWEAALACEGQIDVEFRLMGLDRHWRWLRTRGAPLLEGEGPAREWIGVIEDISARKTNETELRRERERLTLATQVGGLGVWDYEIEADRLECDEHWHRIVGRSIAQPVTTMGEWKRCIHPEDAGRVTSVDRSTLTELAASQENYGIVFRIVRPDGEVRWVRSTACVIAGSAGIPHRAVGVLQDITQSRLAEQELQDSYDFLRQAEQLARMGSWNLDLDTGAFRSSDMMYEMNGWNPATPLTVRDLRGLMTPDSLERVESARKRCVETGMPYHVEITHLRSDGTSFPAHIRGQAIRYEDGRVVALSGTLQDVTERHEHEARLAALADNLPSGALYRLEQKPGGTLVLTYVSGGIQRLIGITADEVIEDRGVFLSLIHPDDLPAYQAAVDRSIPAGAVFDQEVRVKTRDGRGVWMHFRSAPRAQADGRTVWDGIMRDITQEKLAAQALQDAKEKAEAAERSKSDFLAAMSHEIRTPMNTVIGMTRLALHTEMTPRQRNYLEKVETSAKTLLGIINDILDFSKIEAGSLELEDTGFTLESVLESLSAVTAMRAEEKGIEFAFSIAPDVPRSLRGDQLRLGQVLTNLVSNAVKFTAQGEVVVSVATTAREDGSHILQFNIRDTGIGMSDEEVAGLFQPFMQAGSGTARKYGGTGLGLAISRQLVEMMGGRIWVTSQPGHGSIFSFTMPAGRGAGTQPPQAAASGRLRLSGRRALIVDDNASAREILVDMMLGLGFEAEGVTSGEECLPALRAAVARSCPFDIVLMDWRMPSMDGLEAARMIRAEAGLEQIPAVLMVTAFGREEVLRAAEQLGLEGILIKPITESTMFNTVCEILGRPDPGEGSGEADEEARRRRGLPDRNALLSILTGKRALVVDDNAFNREVASDFLTQAGMQVEVALDGFDALEKLEAHAFDVVLMDLHMPRMGGLAATREIRRQARWASLPIIALTAQARTEDQKASLDAGMTVHLTKPIDEQALYRILADLLAPADRGASSADATVETASTPLRLDTPALLRRLGGRSPGRVRQLLEGFLRDFTGTTGRMRQSLQDGLAAEIAALAHTIRGSASYLDATAVCAVAGQLEAAATEGDLAAVASLLPAFDLRLGELLEAVRASLPLLPADPEKEAGQGSVLASIHAALPLVVAGDYAAQPLLDGIRAGLAGRRGRDLAERAQTSFDDLELTQAETALVELKQILEAERRAAE